MEVTSGRRLVVDWVRCDGRGLCVELVPDLLELDDWGFPVVLGPVSPELEKLAERARAACPSMALRLA